MSGDLFNLGTQESINIPLDYLYEALEKSLPLMNPIVKSPEEYMRRVGITIRETRLWHWDWPWDEVKNQTIGALIHALSFFPELKILNTIDNDTSGASEYIYIWYTLEKQSKACIFALF